MLNVLDCYSVPIQMKKGRLGIKLSVLLDLAFENKVKKYLFENTSTLGIRKFYFEREELKREFTVFNSSFGDVKIKESFLNSRKVNSKIEFDDLLAINKKFNVPIKELEKRIYQEYLNIN